MEPLVRSSEPVIVSLAALTAIGIEVLYAVFAGVVIIGWAHVSVALFGHAPNIALLQGAAIACTALVGLYAFWAFIPWWEAVRRAMWESLYWGKNGL